MKLNLHTHYLIGTKIVGEKLAKYECVRIYNLSKPPTGNLVEAQFMPPKHTLIFKAYKL